MPMWIDRARSLSPRPQVLWSDAGSKRLVGLGSSMAGINGLEVEFYEFGPSGHLLHRNKVRGGRVSCTGVRLYA